MSSTLTTFCGSLGNLIRTLRAYEREKSLAKVESVFPEIVSRQTFQFHSKAKKQLIQSNELVPESQKEWLKYKEDLFRDAKFGIMISNQPCSSTLKRKIIRLEDFIKYHKPNIIYSFFNVHIPMFKEYYFILYKLPAKLSRVRKLFVKLNSRLKEINRRYLISRRGQGEKDIYNDDITQVLEEFNGLLPQEFVNWKMTPDNLKLPILSQETKIGFPPSVEDLPELLNYSGNWMNRLKNRPNIGRPPKPFNILLFQIINRNIQPCISSRGKQINKDGKLRVRKNWQLISATLLWLHVLCDIPEIKYFIKDNKDKEANEALKILVNKIKKEYQNFQGTGKGVGKFEPQFLSNYRHFLNIPYFSHNDWGVTARLL